MGQLEVSRAPGSRGGAPAWETPQHRPSWGVAGAAGKDGRGPSQRRGARRRGASCLLLGEAEGGAGGLLVSVSVGRAGGKGLQAGGACAGLRGEWTEAAPPHLMTEFLLDFEEAADSSRRAGCGF